jgi:serralysin
VIGEVESNNSTGTTQAVDRSLFTVFANADLKAANLPSGIVRGSIASRSDVDYFSIRLEQGEKLILDVDHSRNRLDSEVVLYGPAGTELARSDDAPSFDAGSDQSAASDGHNTDSLLTFRAPSAGTYVIAVRSHNSGSSGAYDLNVSIQPPATAAEIVNEQDTAALIHGAGWSDPELTFSFPTAASDYSDYGSSQTEPASFEQLGAQQQTVSRQVLASVSGFTNIGFTELTASRSTADLRFGLTNEAGGTAHAYLPGPSAGGDLWFNRGSTYSNPIPGNYAYATFIHETGHALGLKHGHEAPALSYAHDSLEYSVMTYRSYVGAPLDGYRNETFGYPQSYMMFDIAALQELYGADFSLNGGDSVYRWSPTNGQMSINGIGQGGAGANRVFMTIWDGGGTDTYDLSNYGSAVSIDLRPGQWTITSPVQLANLGNGHIAQGNVANALLYYGDGRSLIENAVGGSAGDTLTANQAVIHLTGNDGADTFRWAAAGDSRPGSADTIDDFLAGVDHIDLSLLDADSRSAADDAFRWIGPAAFSGAAGELRGEVIGGSLHIFADTNGDAFADFEIVLAGQTIIASSDFVF